MKVLSLVLALALSSASFAGQGAEAVSILSDGGCTSCAPQQSSSVDVRVRVRQRVGILARLRSKLATRASCGASCGASASASASACSTGAAVSIVPASPCSSGVSVNVAVGSGYQAWAAREAQLQAQRGRSGHVQGLPAGAAFAGVGMASVGMTVPTCTPRVRMRLAGDATSCSGGRCYRARVWVR